MTTLRITCPPPFRPLLNETARYLGAYGGRGSMKSHFFGGRCAVLGAMEKGVRIACIREIQKSLKKSSKQLIEDKIIQYGLGSRFDVQETVIKTRTGGEIIFQGMQDHNAESIKSLEGFDIFWVEEANSLSSRSLGLLRPTVRSTPGRRKPQLWASWNPEEPTDPIDVLFRGDDPKNLPGGGVCVKVNYEDNPHFPDDLRAEMEYDKRRDPDKYLHTWLGGYVVNSNKRVFKNFRVMDFDTPATGCNFRFGGDFGFAQDPSVLVRSWIGRLEGTGIFRADGTEVMRAVPDDNGKCLFIDYEAYKVGCEVDHHPALFAGNCPFSPQDPRYWPNPFGDPGIPDALAWPIIADSARPETISYLARRGFQITGARKGPGSVEEGVNFLKMYDIVIHTRCPHTADEYRSYSFKVDETTEPPRVLPILEDKKNHVIDANRYSVENVSRKRGWFG